MRLLITLVILGCAFASAQAQIFVKHDAAGNDDGTSWVDAYTSLQDALEHSTTGDQIWIAAGTYIPQGPTPDSSHFVVDKAVELYGGFAGTESALEDRDWEANLTILSGDINGDDTPGDFEMNRDDNAHHIVMVNSQSGISLVDGLILEGGTTKFANPDFDDLSPWEGGAMHATSEIIVKNCIFRDNKGWRGAALDVSFPDSLLHKVLVGNCLFE